MITVPKRIDLIKALPKGALVAEVGVWRGYFSIEMLNNAHLGKLFLVDPWVKYDDYDDSINSEDMEDNLRQTIEHTRGHKSRIEIVRKMSLDAAADWKTPLDAVYLDGNHSYKHALADLRAWAKCLKPTGVLLGHDHVGGELAQRWKLEVIEAVETFCKEDGWVLTHLTDEQVPSFRLEPKAWKGADL